MTKCKDCDQEIIWKQPYMKGDRPMNPDGAVHDCPKRKQSGGGKFVSAKFSIEKATEIMNMAEGMRDAIMKKREIEILPIEQDIQLIESLFKTLSGSYKE